MMTTHRRDTRTNKSHTHSKVGVNRQMEGRTDTWIGIAEDWITKF